MYKNNELEIYINYKIKYLKNLIKNEPVITRCDRPYNVVSYRCTIDGKIIERRSNTEIGKQLEKTYIKQQEIKNRINNLNGTLSLIKEESMHRERLSLTSNANLNQCREKYGEWKDLKEVPNTHMNKKHFWHNGVDYDSKAEVNIAEIYEALNIPFKHGVEIYINGERCVVDFVPYIEETGDYFLHEHFGMDDRYLYLKNSIRKFEAVQNDGLIIGKDVLLSFESSDNFSDKTYYMNSIAMILKTVLFDRQRA